MSKYENLDSLEPIKWSKKSLELPINPVKWFDINKNPDTE